MTDDGDFIRRWSRRKIESKAGEKVPADLSPAPSVPPVKTETQHEARASQPLPPVESLTPESDFTPFMQAGVDPAVKREALRTLVRDPRFNVMDGLDVYIGDYSIPDPMPPEWLGQLKQLERLGHYIEPEEKPDEVPVNEPVPGAGEPAIESQKAMHEQPLAFPEEAPPADTASKDPHAPD